MKECVRSPMKFRKKPVVIEAWQYPESATVYDNAFLHRWINENGGKTLVVPEWGNAVRTLEGLMLIWPGDWVIRGVKGEFYPCKRDIFEATYELAEIRAKGKRP